MHHQETVSRGNRGLGEEAREDPREHPRRGVVAGIPSNGFASPYTTCGLVIQDPWANDGEAQSLATGNNSHASGNALAGFDIIGDVIGASDGDAVTGSGNHEGYVHVLHGKKSGWTTPYSLSGIFNQ